MSAPFDRWEKRLKLEAGPDDHLDPPDGASDETVAVTFSGQRVRLNTRRAAKCRATGKFL
jgi:hypothetical protein